MREIISIANALALLNDALKADRNAISMLIRARVPCNRAMTYHPTIQCWDNKVGPLGLLNGLFGVDDRGWGPICAIVDEFGIIERFERTPTESSRGTT